MSTIPFARNVFATMAASTSSLKSIVPTTSAKAKQLKAFISWAITTGQADGPKLDFAPLPAKIITADKATLAKLG